MRWNLKSSDILLIVPGSSCVTGCDSTHKYLRLKLVYESRHSLETHIQQHCEWRVNKRGVDEVP